jgi:hypothetical protein
LPPPDFQLMQLDPPSEGEEHLDHKETVWYSGVQGLVHHANWEALKESASEGCKICIILWCALWQGVGGEARLKKRRLGPVRLKVSSYGNSSENISTSIEVCPGFGPKIIEVALRAKQGRLRLIYFVTLSSLIISNIKNRNTSGPKNPRTAS